MDKATDRFQRARAALQAAGRPLRTGEITRLGIHPDTLYTLVRRGEVQRLAPGLYVLADLPPLTLPDLVTVALKVPRAVVCLVSALAYHELTTQIPRWVDLALEVGSSWKPPRLEHPPLRVYYFKGRMFTEGVEAHRIGMTDVRIYSPEKTIADCFKFRNKIGLDVALEALKLYLERPQPKLDELVRFSRICRVEKVMRPYLEALV